MLSGSAALSSHRAQLGVLRLELPEIPLHLATEWSTLAPWVCRLNLFRDDDRQLLHALLNTLEDTALGFGGEYKSVQPDGGDCDGFLLVRCWILPSDAAGSAWKRTSGKSSQRPARLRRLMEHMRGDWEDGGGEYLFVRIVSRTLQGEGSCREVYD